MRMMGELLLVDRIREFKQGSIHLPEELIRGAKRKKWPYKGRVIAAGPGRKARYGKIIPNVIKKGNIVYYWRNVGEPVDWDGREVYIMKESQVLGVERGDSDVEIGKKMEV